MRSINQTSGHMTPRSTKHSTHSTQHITANSTQHSVYSTQHTTAHIKQHTAHSTQHAAEKQQPWSTPSRHTRSCAGACYPWVCYPGWQCALQRGIVHETNKGRTIFRKYQLRSDFHNDMHRGRNVPDDGDAPRRRRGRL